MIAPFVRELRRVGTAGRDVTAVQRALAYLGLREGKPTGVYGRATVQQVNAAKRKYRLPADGVYGRALHRDLVAARAFDAYGGWLLANTDLPEPVARFSDRIVSVALYASRLRDRIGYTQGSQRMEGVREKIRPPAVPSYEDCSSFVTWCYWVAGAADPNGRGYDGFGYTGTLIQNGRRILLAQVRTGDLVFYGRDRNGNPTHVAVHVGGGRVVSHGSEAGPLLLPVGYRGDLNQVRAYLS